MARGKISAEFGPNVTKEKIMAASGEVDLEYQLEEAYKLQLCHVIADLHQDELSLEPLGAAGAAFLGREIARGDKMVIGVGYGRTLEACVAALPEQSAPHVEFLPLMGSLTARSSAGPHEAVDRLAKRLGASAFVMPVPFVANSIADRQVLLSQHGVAETYAKAGESDLMLVGVGATDSGASLVSSGLIDAAEVRRIRDMGGVGELLGHFFSLDGRPIETDFTRRIVTLPLDKLRGRRIVAVAGGKTKIDAVRAVLASGLITGLVTDEHTARAIVEGSRDRGPASAKALQ